MIITGLFHKLNKAGKLSLYYGNFVFFGSAIFDIVDIFKRVLLTFLKGCKTLIGFTLTNTILY